MASKKDETKLPLLTSNKTSMLMASEKRKADEGTIQARHKSFQASSTLTSGKFSTSFDVSNSN